MEWGQDADDYDSDFSGEGHEGGEEGDNEFNTGDGVTGERRRKRNRDVLPPLLAKVNGAIEVRTEKCWILLTGSYSRFPSGLEKLIIGTVFSGSLFLL